MPITSATRFATRLKSFQEELFQAAFQLQEKMKEASSRKSLMKVLKISFLFPLVTLFFPISRLIAHFDFNRQAAFVKWFGRHKDYDKIDPSEVKHDYPPC